jgi:hypothetical protein
MKADGLTVILYYGERAYSINAKPVVVTTEEHNLLQCFLDRRIALATDDLEKVVANAARVIGQLEKRFPGAVQRPKRKGEGYSLRVRTM